MSVTIISPIFDSLCTYCYSAEEQDIQAVLESSMSSHLVQKSCTLTSSTASPWYQSCFNQYIYCGGEWLWGRSKGHDLTVAWTSRLSVLLFLTNSQQLTNNVGNQSFLAVKLALMEWCHWLEGGALHPFIAIIIVSRVHVENLPSTSSSPRANSRNLKAIAFRNI